MEENFNKMISCGVPAVFVDETTILIRCDMCQKLYAPSSAQVMRYRIGRTTNFLCSDECVYLFCSMNGQKFGCFGGSWHKSSHAQKFLQKKRLKTKKKATKKHLKFLMKRRIPYKLVKSKDFFYNIEIPCFLEGCTEWFTPTKEQWFQLEKRKDNKLGIFHSKSCASKAANEVQIHGPSFKKYKSKLQQPTRETEYGLLQVQCLCGVWFEPTFKVAYKASKAKIYQYIGCSNYCENKYRLKRKYLKRSGLRDSWEAYYNTAKNLRPAEEVRRCPDYPIFAQVRCKKCSEWYVPTNKEVANRLRTITGKMGGDSNIYCSNGCKKECNIYWRQLYPKDFEKDYSREVQPELRQLVLERDDYTCQRCGEATSLHCHHITGVEQNPLESADVDNCVTLCEDCHKHVHAQKGCNYFELRGC